MSTWVRDFKDKIDFLRGRKLTEQAMLCNKLLSKFHKPTSYLEIGVDRGATFKKIECKIKRGVDPYGVYDVDYRMSSEMYFALNKLFFHHRYDVIFIDASHLSLIVDKEIEESLYILNKGGYIVLHDTDPPSKEVSDIVPKDMMSYLRNLSYPHNRSHTDSLVWKAYNGDVWKSVAKIRMFHPEVEVVTIEGFCCSVLKKGKQKKLMKIVPEAKLNWQFFISNRKKILNVIHFNQLDKYLDA